MHPPNRRTKIFKKSTKKKREKRKDSAKLNPASCGELAELRGKGRSGFSFFILFDYFFAGSLKIPLEIRNEKRRENFMEKRVSFGCEGVARATWLEILLVPKIKQKKRGKEGKQREREREKE